MGLKRRRDSQILKEWIECGFLYNKSQVKVSLPIKHVVIAYDPESREDYPMYADRLSTVNQLKDDLTKRGQKVIEVIHL